MTNKRAALDGKPVFITEIGERFVRKGLFYIPIRSFERAYVLCMSAEQAREMWRANAQILGLNNITTFRPGSAGA